MAAKLARLVYCMLRFGMEFIDRGAQFYEAQMHGLQVCHPKWKAAKLGFPSCLLQLLPGLCIPERDAESGRDCRLRTSPRNSVSRYRIASGWEVCRVSSMAILSRCLRIVRVRDKLRGLRGRVVLHTSPQRFQHGGVASHHHRRCRRCDIFHRFDHKPERICRPG